MLWISTNHLRTSGLRPAARLFTALRII